MTREEARKFLNNTKVYVNGKSMEIQEKLFSLGYTWECGETDICHTREPFLFIYPDMVLTKSSDMVHFRNHENREITAEEILNITVDAKYRPFKDKEECWAEMQKHQPFGWLKKNNSFLNILEVHDDGALISNNYYYPGYKETFANYQFADGTPFGIKEE